MIASIFVYCEGCDEAVSMEWIDTASAETFYRQHPADPVGVLGWITPVGVLLEHRERCPYYGAEQKANTDVQA